VPGILIRPGDVVRLKFPDSAPPGRNKFCLCVCVEHGLFFTINSNQYRGAPPSSQIKIKASQMSFLQHDSYLDVSVLKRIPPEVSQAGTIMDRPQDNILNHLKNVIVHQPFLPMTQRKLIEKNWP
jgi:hypothetical protein